MRALDHCAYCCTTHHHCGTIQECSRLLQNTGSNSSSTASAAPVNNPVLVGVFSAVIICLVSVLLIWCLRIYKRNAFRKLLIANRVVASNKLLLKDIERHGVKIHLLIFLVDSHWIHCQQGRPHQGGLGLAIFGAKQPYSHQEAGRISSIDNERLSRFGGPR